MDMLRAERLNRITMAEDAARRLRNEMRKRAPYEVTQRDIVDLADAVAQGLQAIREQL